MSAAVAAAGFWSAGAGAWAGTPTDTSDETLNVDQAADTVSATDPDLEPLPEPTPAPEETVGAAEDVVEPVQEALEEAVGATEAVTQPVEEAVATTEAVTQPVEDAVGATEPATKQVDDTLGPDEPATEPVREAAEAVAGKTEPAGTGGARAGGGEAGGSGTGGAAAGTGAAAAGAPEPAVRTGGARAQPSGADSRWQDTASGSATDGAGDRRVAHVSSRNPQADALTLMRETAPSPAASAQLAWPAARSAGEPLIATVVLARGDPFVAAVELLTPEDGAPLLRIEPVPDHEPADTPTAPGDGETRPVRATVELVDAPPPFDADVRFVVHDGDLVVHVSPLEDGIAEVMGAAIEKLAFTGANLAAGLALALGLCAAGAWLVRRSHAGELLPLPRT